MSLSASFSLICWKIRRSSRLSLSDRNKQPQELIVASKQNQISRLHDKLILFRNLFGGLKRHTSLSDISKWQTKKKLFFFMCFFSSSCLTSSFYDRETTTINDFSSMSARDAELCEYFFSFHWSDGFAWLLSSSRRGKNWSFLNVVRIFELKANSPSEVNEIDGRNWFCRIKPKSGEHFSCENFFVTLRGGLLSIGMDELRQCDQNMHYKATKDSI